MAAVGVLAVSKGSVDLGQPCWPVPPSVFQ